MLIEPSKSLRTLGVNVFAIGATPIAPVDELKTISGDDRGHVMSLQNYDQLPAAVEQVKVKACRLAGIVRRSKQPRHPFEKGKFHFTLNL